MYTRASNHIGVAIQIGAPTSECLLEAEALSCREEVDLDSPKNEKTLRIARRILPLSLDLLPLESHEILLGAPLSLNPPSISV